MQACAVSEQRLSLTHSLLCFGNPISSISVVTIYRIDCFSADHPWFQNSMGCERQGTIIQARGIEPTGLRTCHLCVENEREKKAENCTTLFSTEFCRKCCDFGTSAHEQLHLINKLRNENKETQLHATANEIQ